jgi:glycosyltransferase involved in cell wall biosynthesis
MNKSSNLYKDGISVVLCVFNDEKNIESCLTSLMESEFEQLIVSDGGSTDNTVDIAKFFTNDVIIIDKGFFNQCKAAFDIANYKYLISIEADHIYPSNFCQNFLSAFKKSSFDGMQGTLICSKKSNYFERGLDLFYNIHQKDKGQKEIIGGPNIFKTQLRKEIHEKLSVQGYSIDTEMAETLKTQGYKVGLSSIEAFQSTSLDYKKFKRKYFNYGKGDYDLYTQHKSDWNFKRKFKSITHVFNRYIIDYPFKAIRMGKVLYVPYFWLSAIFRYAGWVWAIIKGK